MYTEFVRVVRALHGVPSYGERIASSARTVQVEGSSGTYRNVYGTYRNVGHMAASVPNCHASVLCLAQAAHHSAASKSVLHGLPGSEQSLSQLSQAAESGEVRWNVWERIRNE